MPCYRDGRIEGNAAAAICRRAAFARSAAANITDLPQTRGKASLEFLRTRYVNWNTYVMENGVPARLTHAAKKSHLLPRYVAVQRDRERGENILFVELVWRSPPHRYRYL